MSSEPSFISKSPHPVEPERFFDTRPRGDAAPIAPGLGAPSVPRDIDLTLLERCVDWFRGGARGKAIRQHVNVLCSTVPDVSVQQRMAAVGALFAAGRGALRLACERVAPDAPARCAASTAGLRVRVAVSGNVIAQFALAPADLHTLAWLMAQPYPHDGIRIAPDLRNEVEAYVSRAQWDAQRKDLCAKVETYCRESHLPEAALALAAVAEERGPEGYANLVRALPDFDALHIPLRNDLLAMALLIDADTADAARRYDKPARKCKPPCGFVFRLFAGRPPAELRYQIGVTAHPERAFGEGVVPRDDVMRVCAISAMLILNALSQERRCMQEAAHADLDKYVRSLLVELTDEAAIRPGDLALNASLDNPALNSQTYVRPEDDAHAYERVSIGTQHLPQFVARFGAQQLCFSDRPGEHELRSGLLRALLRHQEYGSLRDLFLQLRGTEYDVTVLLMCKSVLRVWEVAQKFCDDPVLFRIKRSIEDFPVQNTTVGRVIDPRWNLRLRVARDT